MEPLACSTGCSKDYYYNNLIYNDDEKNVSIDAGAAEQREWWEIASLADGQMEWTALRKRPDGTTFVQGTKWKKVNP